MRRCLNCLLGGLVLSAASAAPAALVYDNTATDTGYAAQIAGASDGTSTKMLADDITPIAGHAGESVVSVSFKLFNNSLSSAIFEPTLRFYQANGVAGGPGTLIAAVPLGNISMVGNEDREYTANNPDGIFTLPSGKFWAGIAFDGAPADTLNGIEQDIFDPPTVGTSTDNIFITSGTANDASNPAGSITSFGGNPVANLNWSFTTAPEPATLGLIGSAALLMVRRRRGQ